MQITDTHLRIEYASPTQTNTPGIKKTLLALGQHVSVKEPVSEKRDYTDRNINNTEDTKRQIAEIARFGYVTEAAAIAVSALDMNLSDALNYARDLSNQD